MVVTAGVLGSPGSPGWLADDVVAHHTLGRCWGPWPVSLLSLDVVQWPSWRSSSTIMAILFHLGRFLLDHVGGSGPSSIIMTIISYPGGSFIDQLYHVFSRDVAQ
jgi:hypothetical protein